MNYGKQFEAKFKSDWKKSFPDGVIIRIYDVVSGMRSISNISDFIGYVDGKLYLLECKSHKGASIPFDVISQYEKLKSFVGIPGVRSGVIVWLYEKDKCYYVPVKTITQAKKDKEKSLGLRNIDKYDIVEIPSVKKRVFMDSDYSVLKDLPEGW